MQKTLLLPVKKVGTLKSFIYFYSCLCWERILGSDDLELLIQILDLHADSA